MRLELPGRRLDLSAPVVMGILNVTPDSFSDGGRHRVLDAAVARARAMVGEGAAIIDVGGESTRPGAVPVGEAEELDRVIPVVERLAREFDCVISIDTMKPAVMLAAGAAGAHLVNDVNALRARGAVEAVRDGGLAACLMHMRGEPQTMQDAPAYEDVGREVEDFLAIRVRDCIAAGIPRAKLLIDPGFGFGKQLEHNLSLFAQLPRFVATGLPVLVGVSRKGMLGQLLNLPVERRVHAGLSAAALAAWFGASVIRTHDVQATAEAVNFAAAIRRARS
ncbi:MAG: dihydropteroate synthase [Nevskia sp.]